MTKLIALGCALLLLGGCALLLLGGCALSIGTTSPQAIETTDAEGTTTTVVAYETKGIHLGAGNGGIGSDTVRGGSISGPFADLLGGLVGTVGRLVGAFLSPVVNVSAALSEPEAAPE